ncbi:MAG: response regulator [Deltaproteobacteria bacterium]|nr:response regulator [Deltaproteobacteria bacterium]
MLVEDNHDDRVAFRRALGPLHCEVVEAATAEQALDILSANPEDFDAVVADHHLPRMSGLELCKELLAREVPFPLVILTGKGSEVLAVEALKAGVADYIVKDLSQAYLTSLPSLMPRIIGEHQDRRQQSLHQDQLCLAAEQRKKLLDSLPVGIIALDAKKRITEINRTALEMTGFAEADCVGEACEEILRCDVCGAGCPMEKAMRSRDTVGPTSSILYNRKGQVIPISLMSAGVVSPQGKLLGGVELFQDVSDLKALEEERSSMLSTLIHDMKTPLVCIKGFAKLLPQQAPELQNDPAKSSVEVITREAQNLEALVKDFLEFSRQNRGGLRLNLSLADLRPELRALAAKFQNSYREKKLGLELDLPPEPCLIWADLPRLHRAITNLLDNALTYSPAGGAVRLALVHGPYEAILEVADQGVGISSAELPHIFEPFFRGSQGGRGYGLGLAGVKAVVEGHGGRIGVESVPGRGSLFRVTLPLGQDQDLIP